MSPRKIVKLVIINLADDTDVFSTDIADYLLPTFPYYIFDESLTARFLLWSTGKKYKASVTQ